MARLTDLRKIICNGYTRQARNLLRGQGIECLSSNEKVRAMLHTKIKVSEFDIPATHKVNPLRNSVNNGACELVEATEKSNFMTKVASLYGLDDVPEIPFNTKDYYIKKAGKEVGYITMQQDGDTIRLGNFAIVPEQRASRTVMEALISLRDEVATLAKKTGARKVKAEVDVDKPELLSLYKRFGFEPISKVEFENPFGVNMGGQFLLEATI